MDIFPLIIDSWFELLIAWVLLAILLIGFYIAGEWRASKAITKELQGLIDDMKRYRLRGE